MCLQSKVSSDAFKKLIKICCKNNILNIQNLDTSRSSVHYGPLGSLLKRNIFNEWLSSHLNSSEVNMFPLEISHPREKEFLTSSISKEASGSLLKETLENCDITYSLSGILPVGFATYGPCVHKNIETNNSTTSSDLNILSDLQAWTRLSVIFFCPIKNSMNWFYHWSKQRYLWWRKYSSIPSKFSMSDVSTSSIGTHQLSLLLEFPWGKQHLLETITLHESDFCSELWHNYHSQKQTNCKQSASTVVITCETELDLAVLAYLSNSYSEKWRSGETKNLFQLHYKLAPYKVCLFLEETDAELLKKMKTVASHLAKEFKDTGISVFPTAEPAYSITKANRFDKFDEMGLPYIVVLNENSIQTGIAGLRNRDTTLQEQVHITELTAKLVKYLKIRL